MSQTGRLTLRAAQTTALYLIGGLLVAFPIGFAVSAVPIHIPAATKNSAAALVASILLIATGALWGRALGRALQLGAPRRLAWAGGLSFGPAAILAGLALSALEVAIVERGLGPRLPIHILYTLLFVPATFVVAALGALSVGLALRNTALALRLALTSGLAAAAAFLVINAALDALGWRVGGPNAAARATMLIVTLLSTLAAALAGGAALGRTLATHPTTLTHPTAHPPQPTLPT